MTDLKFVLPALLALVVGACGSEPAPPADSGPDPDAGLSETADDAAPTDLIEVSAELPNDTAPMDTGPAHCPGHDDATHALWVAPYVQWVTPTSAWILWETVGGAESRVVWGTDAPNLTTCGAASDDEVDGNILHRVRLEGLAPDTVYAYRVVTGATESETFRFKTAPTPDSEASVRLIVLSDSQFDGSNPDVLREIVEDGVLGFMLTDFDGEIEEELEGVLLAGDLVDVGWNYDEWAETFFGPASAILSSVPLYPVPGNHEGDSPYYFRYFELPDNGLPETLEHQWSLQISNVLLVGLDSNSGYRTEAQLDWLAGILDGACDDPHIDFVFAELHHPHKSELWIEGEIDYTGEVIARLEAFSTDCGKPSIHFFGHTHGYSRGQSREHQHLWVNAATAGGNIDYWGEYAQMDYDEFTVSQDEWGFVLLEVEAGDDPKFRLRRVSRGNELVPRANEIRDDLTIRRYNAPPAAPTASPVEDPACGVGFKLEASAFVDPDGGIHQGSHFQVSTSCDDFTRPVFERWLQRQNQFGGKDLMAGVPLTEVAPIGLKAETAHCWRVRYRDDGLVWSPWSAPQPFTTAIGTTSENLLVNGDAESGTTGWTLVAGIFESLTAGECDGINPHGGDRYFVVGGICQTAGYGEVTQTVEIPEAFHAGVDDGKAWVELGGWLSNWGGDDVPAIRFVLRDAAGETIATSATLSTGESSWTWLTTSIAAPPGTRTVEVTLTGTLVSGTDNDSYIDDLSLSVGACGTLGAP